VDDLGSAQGSLQALTTPTSMFGMPNIEESRVKMLLACLRDGGLGDSSAVRPWRAHCARQLDRSAPAVFAAAAPEPAAGSEPRREKFGMPNVESLCGYEGWISSRVLPPLHATAQGRQYVPCFRKI